MLPHAAHGASLCINARLLLLALLCREDLVLLWLSLVVAIYYSRETNVVSLAFFFFNIVTQPLLMGHW